MRASVWTAGHVFDDVALLVAGVVIIVVVIVWNQKRREFSMYLKCQSLCNFSAKYCNYSVKYIYFDMNKYTSLCRWLLRKRSYFMIRWR
jgi:hypothetical protein